MDSHYQSVVKPGRKEAHSTGTKPEGIAPALSVQPGICQAAWLPEFYLIFTI